ncbi:MAG: ABC transporter ATP-binding protein [Planctomycetota bacterium]|jgi:ATP-binding cassette subfamily B protein
MGHAPSIKASIPGLRSIVVRFWPQLRSQRLLLGGSATCMFAEILVRLAEPWPLKFVFDRVITSTPSGGGSGIAVIDGLAPLTLLTACAAAVVLLAALRAVTAYLSVVGFALAGNRVLTASRGELFTHLQRLSLSFHDRKRTGDLITRVTGDIGRLKEVAVTAVLPLFVHAIMLVGMLVVMLLIEWRLALIAVAVLPVFVLSTQRIGGRIRTVARKQRQRESEIGATTAEVMSSIRTVQALSLEEIQSRTFTAQNRASLREGVKAKRLSARLVGTVDVLVAVATAGVLLFGARLVLGGDLTPGDLVVFLAYLKNAFKPMRDLAKYSGRVARAAASAERIVEVLDTTPLIRDRPDAREAPTDIAEVGFNDVTFAYGDAAPALDGLSLTARRGEMIALAGPSGAGKSSALSLLLRLYDPQHGAITLDGVDLRDCTVDSLRRRIAVVPQENVLFAVSVRENIAYGAPGADDAQILTAARRAHADEFITRMPNGYDTVVGERGATLSEGQRKRIAVARAIVREAPILVLDEPSASLDNDNNRLLRRTLRELRPDRITLIIAHDLSTVEDADRILYLEHGRIVEEGTHAELLARNGRYATMYRLQLEMAGEHMGRDDALAG